MLPRDQRRDDRPATRRALVVFLLAAGFAGAAIVIAPSAVAAEKAKKGKAQKPPSADTGETSPSTVKVVDGVVQPRRPIAQAIPDAIEFLRKADGGYVPGRIEGELAGYFMSAHVNSDGSRVTRRQLSFPARQHAYFIRTFLNYHAYTGEREWLLRARDLADWNLAHSTPATAAYPSLPYSAHQDGKPTGSADQKSIETDKPAFIGMAYLALYESTGDARYLEGARKIAETLAPKQRADGSWPFRVIPEDGTIFEDMGGAPVFFVEFFERLGRHDDKPAWRRAREQAMRLLMARNVEQGQWGTYHEDIRPKEGTHLSAEPMSFTADYLFRHARTRPEYIEMGRRVLRQMEAKLVHTQGHAAAPAPAVAEQVTFAHIMAGHTARYCLALANLFLVTREPEVKRRALSGLNAVTYMQSGAGLFRTHFYDTRQKKEKDPASVNNWYSQHLYTVCHLLECMVAFPEVAPDGEDHILGSSVGLRDVGYGKGSLRYATIAPAEVTMKLGFMPKTVQAGGRSLKQLAKLPAGEQGSGWNFDPKTKVLVIRHDAGEVSVTR
ncbi:MAG: hypothetical protein Q7S40_18285 [Opitutaceae bacterium]|nr:hypothetical protein [Opitutaceae bacterium]